MLLWVEPFMWAVCNALAYAMQFIGFFGLATIAVAWCCTRMEEILED